CHRSVSFFREKRPWRRSNMQQELIIALMLIVGVAAAYLVSERQAHSHTVDNGDRSSSSFTHASGAAQATGLLPGRPTHAEPLLRFFDQEVQARVPGETARPTAARPMSFLIRQTEGRHFECYVLRPHR
ncbi:MAG TPA: hypothetical protein VI756_07215, partial [Blastocatellia bacterium]